MLPTRTLGDDATPMEVGYTGKSGKGKKGGKSKGKEAKGKEKGRDWWRRSRIDADSISEDGKTRDTSRGIFIGSL